MEVMESVDLSRLQQHSPFRELHLSLFDLMKYVSVGTSELLHYLLKETHIILECRACSNLFRDVPYLVAHKRIYCKQRHNVETKIQTNCQDPPDNEEKDVNIVKPEIFKDQEEFLQHSVQLAKKVLQNSQVTNCTQILSNNGPTKKQFYDAVQTQLEIARDNPQSSQSFSLEPMENTDVAVKVIPKDIDDESKDEDNDCSNASKESGNVAVQDNQGESKTESCENLNSSTLPSSSSFTLNCIGSENKNDFENEKPRGDLASFKNLLCLKCNRTMPTQKALADHLMAVHPDELKERSGYSCMAGSSMPQFHERPVNGLRPRVGKTDWLKPKGYIEKPQIKPTPVINAAKEVLDAKKKAQANLLALKEEQLAYENEILQQKLIRGIMPKSSRGRKKFRCESCGKIFPKIESLRDHLRDCIDWEHVNQPIRNVRSPLPSLKETNSYMATSVPASMEWTDSCIDDDYNVQTSRSQNRTQTRNENTTRLRSASSKIMPVTRLQVAENSKLLKINGTIKTISDHVTQGNLMLINPKLNESKVLLLPLESMDRSQTLNVNVKTKPSVEIYNHNMKTINPPLSDSSSVSVDLCSDDTIKNDSPRRILRIQQPTIATNGNHVGNSAVHNETKEIEIIAVKCNAVIHGAYKEAKGAMVGNRWNDQSVSTSMEQSLPNNSQTNASVLVNRHVPNLHDSLTASIQQDFQKCDMAEVCQSACCSSNDVEILEHLSSSPLADDPVVPTAVRPSADNEDVIVISKHFSIDPPPVQTAKKNDVVVGILTSQCDKIIEGNTKVSQLLAKDFEDFGKSSDKQLPSMDLQRGKIPYSTKTRKCVIWRRYKCKLCIFSARNRLQCKSHLRECHLDRIYTLPVRFLNHYIVDLKDQRRKPCCSYQGRFYRPWKAWRYNSNPPIFKGSTSWKNVPQKSGNTNQPQNSSLLRKFSSAFSLARDNRNIQDFIDSKKRQCLKCNRTFQKLSHLERHVACHFCWKYQRKVCTVTDNNLSKCKGLSKQCKLGKAKCSSTKPLECLVVDLTGEQFGTVNDSKRDSVISESLEHFPSIDGATGTVTAALGESCSPGSHWEADPSTISISCPDQLSVLNTRKGSYQKPELSLELKTKPLKRNVKKMNS